MAGLTLENISKQFKDSDEAAVRNINLQMEGHEFLVLLGPSGCGKTTLLRMISGLVTPTQGRILIDGRDVTELEPQERGIGMVFQNYALYPHMNVHRNLSFALEIAGMKREQRRKVVGDVGVLLGIRQHFHKKPHMLSGGERQRVAMGRAMVNECRLYLFDEPLSNLDEALRARLRPEILKQFHELEVPFVYVTHDQVDAMTMGTKIAVMQEGEIRQLGTPQEIYERPANVFVAGFVGTPKMNLLTMRVVRKERTLVLADGEFTLALPQYEEKLGAYVGKEVLMGIRPEDVLTMKSKGRLCPLSCTLRRYEHLGNKIQLFTEFGENMLRIAAPVTVRAKVGERMEVYLDTEKVHLFDTGTQMRV